MILLLLSECLDGSYGADCNKTCGQCINDEPCLKESGECSNGCAAGFNGTMCNEGKTVLGSHLFHKDNIIITFCEYQNVKMLHLNLYHIIPEILGRKAF